MKSSGLNRMVITVRLIAEHLVLIVEQKRFCPDMVFISHWHRCDEDPHTRQD